jgi:hypothetical protein
MDKPLAPTVSAEMPTKFGSFWRVRTSGGVLMRVTVCSAVDVVAAGSATTAENGAMQQSRAVSRPLVP